LFFFKKQKKNKNKIKIIVLKNKIKTFKENDRLGFLLLLFFQFLEK
jgi:hypothetical protein